MKIWLDTINLDLVAEAGKMGILFGITTNPSILSKAKNVEKTLMSLLGLQEGPVAVQVTAQDAEAMIEEGMHISKYSPRLIVKVPVTQNGLRAIKELTKRNIPVLGTGILHLSQALLAANLGASYIAPYFSHIGKIANAEEVLEKMVTILRLNRYETKLMVASLKSVDDIIFSARIGADAITIKDDLFMKLVADQASWEKTSQKFQSDWQEAHGNLSIKDLLNY